MKKEDYLQNIKRMTQERKIRPACFICGEDDPLITKEYHHVFGQTYSEVKILLCLNCHAKITGRQNMLPPKERSGKASGKNKIRFFLRTVGALLVVIGEEMQKLGSTC